MTVYTTENGLDPYLKQIIDHCEAFEPNIETVKGRKEIASMAHKVAKAKVALDNIGKELVADLKELPKKIDAERKRMRDLLETLQDEVRAPLTAWEKAEEDRIQRHRDALAALVSLVTDCGETVASIQASIGAVNAVVVDEAWQEFENEATHTKAKALGRLQELLTARQKYEAEQEELARLRQEAAERDKKEREDRIAREAAEAAQRAAEAAQRAAEAAAQAEREAAIRREAEANAAAETARLNAELADQRRIAAERQAELERQAAAERERQAAELAEQQRKDAAEQAAAAERKRIADEQAAADAEAKRREANRAHRAKINRAALEAFVAGGLPEDCAKKAVELIAKGEIPAIKITY